MRLEMETVEKARNVWGQETYVSAICWPYLCLFFRFLYLHGQRPKAGTQTQGGLLRRVTL